MNDSYTPSFLVRQTHQILHLDSSLKRVDSTFNITVNSYYNDYTQSLLPVPLILMVLGLLAILALQFTHCFRCLSKTCCTQPPDVDAIREKSNHGTFRAFFIVFLGVALLTLFADQILLYGNTALNNGVHSSQDAINYVYDLSVSLNSEGVDLQQYGYRILADLVNSTAHTTCTVPPQYYTYVTDYESYVSDFIDTISPVPDQCTNADDMIQKYGITYKNQSIWALYAVLIVCIGLYVLGVICKKKLVVQFGMGFSELLMIVIFLAVGIELIILMGFADFCMSPVDNTLSILPSDLYNVTSYYATCTGVNPLQSSIDSANSYIDQIDSALTTLSLLPTCSGNTYIADAQAAVVSIQSVVTNVISETSCAPTNDQLLQVLETGLCTQSFQGIFLIWIGQYTTTSLLLFATILATIMLCNCVDHFWLSSEDASTAQSVWINEVHNPSTVDYNNPSSPPAVPDIEKYINDDMQ